MTSNAQNEQPDKSSAKESASIGGSLLSSSYPSADDWKKLVQQFSPEAIALKFLLSHIPYVFRHEPLKFAIFRQTVADVFEVQPANVFIVGSAMAGRSLKGDDIDQKYSPESDIDTLIGSHELFDYCLYNSLEWIQEATRPTYPDKKAVWSSITPEKAKRIHWIAQYSQLGIWRPDSLPNESSMKNEFFEKFRQVSIKTLGLQLSDDTVAKVNGRVARSFEDAVKDLSGSIYRLKKEFEGQEPPAENPSD